MDASLRPAQWVQTGADPYKWARATAISGLTFVALRQLPGYSIGLEFILLLGVGLLASVSLPGGILFALFVMGFPIFYSSPVVGIAFAVIAVVSFQYLSLVDGRAFFLLGFLLIAVFFKLEWAFPLLVGFYLGGTTSFALGFCGAILVEAIGLLLGRQSIGSLYSHGSSPLWNISHASLPPFTDWAWLAPKFAGGAPLDLLTDFARRAITSATLIVQPLVWGAVCAFVGAAVEKRWRNVLLVFPLALGGLLLLTLVVGSMNKLPDIAVQELLARYAFGLAAAVAVVGVAMMGERRIFAEGVMVAGMSGPATVTTGSSFNEGPVAPTAQTSGAIDSLTGLFRREHLDVSLPARLEAALESGQPLAFCMIDLDRFKQVNDTKGHQAGDRVLTDVAGILRSVIDIAGDVVRYGGDEFCVILPATTAEGARQIMNQAAADLEAWDFVGLENVLRPTFSMGIAEFPRMATVQEDLIERADQALYLSKNMGRNTITVYGEQVFREQALELTCWMAMQCFLTVNGRIRADSWRIHPGQSATEIVTAFDYTATIPYVSKTASLVTDVKTYKSSFEGKILRIVSMSDNQTQFILLVQKEDLPLKMKEHVAELEAAGEAEPAGKTEETDALTHDWELGATQHFPRGAPDET